ncbi:hypothetical protein QSJ19_01130 [Gordonia sp. ABSL11-1]|uniref:hypothetical protein n=1 Tax=Gordonia sp. ABSL11-1 TaxID=3053924 RepID=UPI002573DFB8|nr:hypothetical protein [Gordonia sp. ABSL11-1]MDL9944205.1 hypothetical protein [Gordonia sp. ABSL11-1]
MTTYDETTDLPTEYHQAPDGIDKATPEVPLGSGITVNDHLFTEAKVKFSGGLSEFPIPDPPREEGEVRTYIVKASLADIKYDGKGDDGPRVTLTLKPFVVYDRRFGAMNDRQRVETPDELEALKQKAKETADPDDDVPEDDKKGGLFDDAGEITGDLDNDDEDGPDE